MFDNLGGCQFNPVTSDVGLQVDCVTVLVNNDRDEGRDPSRVKGQLLVATYATIWLWLL